MLCRQQHAGEREVLISVLADQLWCLWRKHVTSVCNCLHVSIQIFCAEVCCVAAGLFWSLDPMCPASTIHRNHGFSMRWIVPSVQSGGFAINKNISFPVGEPTPGTKHPERTLFHPFPLLLKCTFVIS